MPIRARDFYQPTLWFVLACLIQTIIWPFFISRSLCPPIWLLVIVSLTLSRPRPSSLVVTYFLAFIALAFSTMTIRLFFLTLFFLHLILISLRARLYKPELSYFLSVSVLSTFLFHVLSFTLSQFLDKSPLPLLFFERLSHLVTILPFAFLFYKLTQNSISVDAYE